MHEVIVESAAPLINTLLNPFYATGLFLYPLKTSENQRFSDVFMGYRKRPVGRNGLKGFSFFYIDFNNFTYLLMILHQI